MIRLRCWLLGCCEDADAPACHRCGVPLYGVGDRGEFFLEHGRLDPLLRLWWRFRQWSWPRCWQCRRLLIFRRRVNDNFCSRECFEQWIPF